MPKVTIPPHKTGDFLVDYEEKVFEDVKALSGQKALVTLSLSRYFCCGWTVFSRTAMAMGFWAV